MEVGKTLGLCEYCSYELGLDNTNFSFNSKLIVMLSIVIVVVTLISEVLLVTVDSYLTLNLSTLW